MPSKLPAVYWDACCFLGRIKRETNRIAELEYLTTEAANEKLLIVTSVITIAEVLQTPSEEALALEGIKQIKDYFEHPWIIVRSVDRKTAETAADIRREYADLKLPDAIHVATALRWGVKHFHTYDEKHLLSKDGKIGNPPLQIMKPQPYQDLPLFASALKQGTAAPDTDLQESAETIASIRDKSIPRSHPESSAPTPPSLDSTSAAS